MEMEGITRWVFMRRVGGVGSKDMAVGKRNTNRFKIYEELRDWWCWRFFGVRRQDL